MKSESFNHHFKKLQEYFTKYFLWAKKITLLNSSSPLHNPSAILLSMLHDILQNGEAEEKIS